MFNHHFELESCQKLWELPLGLEDDQVPAFGLYFTFSNFQSHEVIGVTVLLGKCRST